MHDQPRGKQDACRESVLEGAEHSPPCLQQAAETPETSRLSQPFSALLGKVPTSPESSQFSKTEATFTLNIPTTAQRNLNSELLREISINGKREAGTAQPLFPQQNMTSLHKHPCARKHKHKINPQLPLKEKALAQQTFHLLNY